LKDAVVEDAEVKPNDVLIEIEASNQIDQVEKPDQI